MDRAETTGLGVAIVAHGVLLAALGQGLGGFQLPRLHGDPIEVSFAEDVGLTSAAPELSSVPPAPSLAPELGAPEQAAPRSADAIVSPQPDRPAATPTPAPPEQKSGSGKGSKNSGKQFGQDIVDGLGDDPSPSQSKAVPASAMSAAARSSLSAEIRRQLKPHWKAPTGADAERLRTELSVSLGRDGRVLNIEVVETTGQTASNRPQVRLHQEQAIRAVRLAAPFRLPAEFYDAWKVIEPAFDRRLSQ